MLASRTPSAELRPIKFLLPPTLIRRMEKVISVGLGGFTDRHEFAAAAIDAYLLDLDYAEEGQESAISRIPPSPKTLGSELLIEAVEADAVSLGLPSIERGTAVTDTVSALRDEPLLGLHNRDWPSLWALNRLAAAARMGPVTLRTFLERVTAEAWNVADQLTGDASSSGAKSAALLPKNRSKPQSAEDAFKAFAVATVGRKPDERGRYVVTGPLPVWRAVAFTTDSQGELMIGVTENGWDLVERTAGVSPGMPHPPEVTNRFLEYLQSNSAADWWGFEIALRSLVNKPTRQQYVDAFSSSREWKETVATSTAQGYLARAREWGLAYAKMTDGRYALTKLGQDIATVTLTS